MGGVIVTSARKQARSTRWVDAGQKAVGLWLCRVPPCKRADVPPSTPDTAIDTCKGLSGGGVRTGARRQNLSSSGLHDIAVQGGRRRGTLCRQLTQRTRYLLGG